MQNRNEVINKLGTGAKHGLIGTFGGKLLGVLGNIIAARILNPFSFGLFAIGWTLFRFLSLLIPLGMDRSLLWFGPRLWKTDPNGFKRLVQQAIFVSLGSGIFFGLILFALAPWLANEIYHKQELTTIFQLFSIVFPCASVLIAASAATRITQDVKYSVIIQDIGQPFLGLVLIIAFYLSGAEIKGVVFAEILSFLFSSVAAVLIIFRVFPEIRTSRGTTRISLKESLTYALPASLGGAFSAYLFWVDRLFVGFFLSAFDNGIYLAVSQISTVFSVISAGINTILVPMFSELFHNGDKQNLHKIYRVSTKWGIYLSVPIITVLLVSPSQSLTFIFGREYVSGAIVLVVLLIGQVINLITGPVNPLLIITGHQKFLFTVSGIFLVFDAVLNLVLIPKFGLIGAALSTSITITLLYLIELIWVKHKLGIWPYDKSYSKGFAASVITILGVILVASLHPSGTILSLFVQSVTAVFLFAVSIFCLKLNDEDKRFLSGLLARTRKHGV